MKKVNLLALLCVLSVKTVMATEGMEFGKPITLETSTAIAAILAEPEDYVGEKVRVEGTVIDVCTKQGCWMEIAIDNPEERIQAKVEDGVIVFPQEAKGRAAVVEGEVQKLELSLEQTVAFLKHEAEEKGIAFDPSAVKEPRNFYRIWVSGATVK